MINVNFTGYTKYTVDKVTQWDTDRKLRITGIGVSGPVTIYFSNKIKATADGVLATRENDVIICDVPNGLLTESYPIYAYLQIREDGELKTIETIKIPVTAAKEPDDYRYRVNIPVVTYESLQLDIYRLMAAVGSPLVAETAAEMTDRDKVYVYVGSETGYTNGNWYYYNGTAWTSGGVYNSFALETDKTLSVPDVAADAKTTGDNIHYVRDLLFLDRGEDITPFPLAKFWSYGAPFSVWDMPRNTFFSGSSVLFKDSISGPITWDDDATYLIIKIADMIYLSCVETKQFFIGLRDEFTEIEKWFKVNQYDELRKQIEKISKEIDGNNYLPFVLKNGRYIHFRNGGVKDSTTLSATDYIEIPESAKTIIYMRMIVPADSTTNIGMAFYDADKTFISGIQNKTNAEGYGEELYEAQIPDNAVYARFSYYLTTSAHEPFTVYVYDKDNLLARVDSLEKAIIDHDVQLPINMIDGGGIYWSNGELYPSSTLSYSNFVTLPSIAKTIKYMRYVTPTETTNAGMAFYDADKVFILGIPNRTSAETSGAELYETQIPDNAVYARFSYLRTYITTYPPFAAYADMNKIDEISNTPGEVINTLGLHTAPENEGVVNVIKRCREFTDIEWTPAVDLPRFMAATRSTSGVYNMPSTGIPLVNYEGVFKAGVKYRGIPYGRCVSYKSDYGHDNTYVGLTIPFTTFMSSVSNPDSMVSKESSYSKDDHRSIPYAIVCSGLTCYALGLNRYYTAVQIPDIPGVNTIGALTDLNANIIKLGDIVNLSAGTSSHSLIITDLVKEDGQVKFIEISEATSTGNGNEDVNGGLFGGVCRRVFLTTEDFMARYGNYSLLRYSHIESVRFTHNDFVDVGDGINLVHFDNFPCMPYEGVGFKYKAANTDSIKILISCHNYSYLRVYKDDIAIIDIPVESDTEYVTVTTVDVGGYKAFLCNKTDDNITARTAPCYWSVIN